MKSLTQCFSSIHSVHHKTGQIWLNRLFMCALVGYSTLLSVLGVRCLPQHTFLQYVDHGLLQLTEPFVSRLMTGTNLNTCFNTSCSESSKYKHLGLYWSPLYSCAFLQHICGHHINVSNRLKLFPDLEKINRFESMTLDECETTLLKKQSSHSFYLSTS